jgi:hypothetical protein
MPWPVRLISCAAQARCAKSVGVPNESIAGTGGKHRPVSKIDKARVGVADESAGRRHRLVAAPVQAPQERRARRPELFASALSGVNPPFSGA